MTIPGIAPAIAAANPDFQDYFLPIIQSLTLKPVVTANIDATGKTKYQTVILADLQVKVHRNSLTGFRINYRGPVSTAENLCQSISDQAPNWNGIKIGVGNTEYAGGEGDLQVLPGLKSRIPSGDWFLEEYSLALSVPSNQNFFPCFGNNRVDSISIRDIAGRFKQFVSRGDGKPTPLANEQPDAVLVSFRYDSPYLPQLPEYSCPKVIGGEWNSTPLRCQDKFDSQNLQINFSAADKAAADKAAADKAAADKAAADKAAADKAAAVKSPIPSKTSTPTLATPVPGTKCSKAGSVVIASNFKFTCLKAKNKLTWSKGVKLNKVPPTPTPTLTPTPTPTPTIVSVTPGTYKIAFQGPLSGPESAIGVSQLESVRYAIRVFESKYPQVKIDLVLIDDKGDPAIAQAIVPKFIQDKDILGIIGPSYSGSSRISLPFFKEAGLTAISSSASNASLTDPTSTLFAKDVFHRTTSFGMKEAEAIAGLSFNGRTNPKIFVVGVLNDPQSALLSKNIISALKGISSDSLVGFELIQEDNSDSNSIINTIVGNASEVVVFTGYGATATKFLAKLRAAGSKATFVAGTNVYFDKEFKVPSNESAGGVKVLGIPNIRDISSELYASYKKITGSEPGVYSVPTIDATNVYLDGILSGALSRTLMFNYLKTYQGAGLLQRGISFDLFGDLRMNSFVGYDYSTGTYLAISSTL